MWKFTKPVFKVLSILAITLGSFQLQTFANVNTEQSFKDELKMEPAGMQQPMQELAHSSYIDEIDSYEKRTELSDRSVKPPAIEEVEQQAKSMKQAKLQEYTMADLNLLNHQQLVELLSTIEWYQVTDLFKFNNDSLAFYKNATRVQAILDALEEKGKTFTKNDSKGIDTLVEVLRSGYYLAFYHQELSELGTRTYHEKTLPALKAIGKNLNFKLGTAEQDKVVAAYGALIGNSSSNVEIVKLATPILKQYNDSLSNYIVERSKGSAVHSLMKGINYDIQTYLADTNKQPKDTVWYRGIDGFVDELSRFALLGTITKDNGWLINNGIYYTSKFGKFHTSPTIGLQVITEAMSMYPYLSSQYLVAADQISYNYGGIDANGKVIDYDQIIEEGKAKFLPNKYTFDDGAFIIKTGDKVTEEKVKQLYWAAKEVEAQFFRMVGRDTPLESGNVDDVLTMVIYNSPAEYKYNDQLYGYDTDNGGMYIEGIGTFFTYERTPAESIYSLEELFRHEFTHYLQGRYEVPGLWGQGPIYANERLTWFEEGNAELFAGSTRKESIVPRKSMVGGLSTNPENRQTVPQVLNAKYGNFDFYKYSYALQSYMYNKKFDMYDRVHDLIRANDVSGYDAYRSALSADTTLNTEYQNYMQMLIDNHNNYIVPHVSADYLALHAPKAVTEIAAEITADANLENVQVATRGSQFFKTFSVKGSYTGKASIGEYADWAAMDRKINEILTRLDQKEWTGYKTVTGYFTNYRVNAAGQFVYDVAFHGVNTDDGNVNKAPVAVINGPETGKINEAIPFTSEGSADVDGQIISYKWEFGDGQTSMEQNPSHIYTEKGTYIVKLTVTDDKGATGTVSKNVTVQEGEVNKAPVAVINGPETGKMNEAISFTSEGSADVDGQIVSYKWEFGDGQTSMEQNPSHIYTEKGTYTVKLTVTDDKGATGTASSNVTVQADEGGTYIESEPNNSFETANKLQLNKTLRGNLSNNDYTDVFEIDVTKASNLQITVMNEQSIGMSWGLYYETDPNNYLAYPQQVGNKLVGNYQVHYPGKYYLVVYKYSGGSGDYTVEVQ
ncbi:microbial collagenase [Filibacter limicola]|uniref:microbial collagenase n=1 Tax=Sporosarcina limicola TaxID=34101 RepID=A0A927MSM3_9BACL|nr:collagenase ColA [Sporosarcina limicola]MBE1556689.1 microbial collagenase [Sporosarcina limicola]